MKASEARRISKSVVASNNKDFELDLNDVLGYIMCAAQKGQRVTWVYDLLDSKVKKTLRSYGYKIKETPDPVPGDMLVTPYTEIYW